MKSKIFEGTLKEELVMSDEIRACIDTNDVNFINNEYIPKKFNTKLTLLQQYSQDRFNELINKNKKYFGSKKLNSSELDSISDIYAEISRVESKDKNRIIKLAEKIIIDNFKLPSNVKLELDIEDVAMDYNKSDVVIDFDSHEELVTVEDLIKRREVTEILINGSAKHGSMLYCKYEDDIDSIDTDLFFNYNKLLYGNELLDWLNGDNSLDEEGGYYKLIKKGDNIIIEVKALCLPFLLFYTIKALMDLISIKSLPKDKNIRKYIIKNARETMNKSWLNRISGSFWVKINNHTSDYIESCKVFNILNQMTDESYNECIKNILLETKKGKEIIKYIIEKIKEG